MRLTLRKMSKSMKTKNTAFRDIAIAHEATRCCRKSSQSIQFNTEFDCQSIAIERSLTMALSDEGGSQTLSKQTDHNPNALKLNGIRRVQRSTSSTRMNILYPYMQFALHPYFHSERYCRTQVLREELFHSILSHLCPNDHFVIISLGTPIILRNVIKQLQDAHTTRTWREFTTLQHYDQTKQRFRPNCFASLCLSKIESNLRQ